MIKKIAKYIRDRQRRRGITTHNMVQVAQGMYDRGEMSLEQMMYTGMHGKMVDGKMQSLTPLEFYRHYRRHHG